MSELESVNKNDIEWIKDTLREIKTQTTKTNGRVNKLEDEVRDLEKDNNQFQTKVTTIASIIAAGAGFLLNKIV